MDSVRAMGSSSLHVSQHIDRSVAVVYQFASDPARLPDWAAGLGGAVENVNGQWVVPLPEGHMMIEFVPANDYGVLDHVLTLPTGEAVYNPMRVIADGGGCEVVFTLRRQSSMSDEDFDGDARAVAADLASLKRLMEAT